MKKAERELLCKRQVLLERLCDLSLLIQGSYLERFSVCTRENCACRRGRKHGPRSYVVVYSDKRQRQVYVPQSQEETIRKGICQHDQLLSIVREITHINLQLMRAGALTESSTPPRKGETPRDEKRLSQ